MPAAASRLIASNIARRLRRTPGLSTFGIRARPLLPAATGASSRPGHLSPSPPPGSSCVLIAPRSRLIAGSCASCPQGRPRWPRARSFPVALENEDKPKIASNTHPTSRANSERPARSAPHARAGQHRKLSASTTPSSSIGFRLDMGNKPSRPFGSRFAWRLLASRAARRIHSRSRACGGERSALSPDDAHHGHALDWQAGTDRTRAPVQAAGRPSAIHAEPRMHASAVRIAAGQEPAPGSASKFCMPWPTPPFRLASPTGRYRAIRVSPRWRSRSHSLCDLGLASARTVGR